MQLFSKSKFFNVSGIILGLFFVLFLANLIVKTNFAEAATTLTQYHYRWYTNADVITPTSSLAFEDSAYSSSTSGIAYRLRMSVSVSSSQLAAGQAFKLQYQSGTTTGSWSDVGGTGASTIWKLYDNP